MLARLDQAPSAVRRPMRAIRVRNRSVLEMRDIVEQLLSSGFLEAEEEPAAGYEAAPARDSVTGFTPAAFGQGVPTSPVLPAQPT